MSSKLPSADATGGIRQLLLWDIDGTLMSDGGLSHESFHAAVLEVTGVDVADETVRFDGKTDPLIAEELLELAGVPEVEMATLVRRTLRVLGRKMAERRSVIHARGRVLPGVRSLLDDVDRRAVLNSVITGNIAVNAVLKLDAFHLTGHFDVEVGAFGSDRAIRSELVTLALERADEKRNMWFDPESVWVIGDTPHDLAAARASDVHCLLVASGSYGYDELSDLGADAVLADLTDAKGFFDVVIAD